VAHRFGLFAAVAAFPNRWCNSFAWQIDDIKLGSLAAAMANHAVSGYGFLGMYSPFAIRLLMDSKQNAGAVSGTVYGISNGWQHPRYARDHVFPDPADWNTRNHFALGILGLFGGALLFAAASRWRRAARLGVSRLCLRRRQ